MTANEKDDSLQSSIAAPRHQGAARELDERRRTALNQVDEADFSYVKLDRFLDILSVLTLSSIAGSMSKSVVSQALASSPMREWCKSTLFTIY